VRAQAYDRGKRVPVVQPASLSGLMLFGPSDISTRLKIDGYVPGPNEAITVRFNSVSPNYFLTVGMMLLEGRGIEEGDTDKSPFVAVINEAMARRYFGG